MARIASTTTSGVGIPAPSMTLDALMARAKELAVKQGEIAAPREIRSPWQGAAQMMQSFANARAEGAAQDELSQGRAHLAQLVAGIDPEKGASQQQIAEMGMYDPEAAQRAQEAVAQIIHDRRQQEFQTSERVGGQEFTHGENVYQTEAQKAAATQSQGATAALQEDAQAAEAEAAKVKRAQELQDPTTESGKVMRDFNAGLYGDPNSPEAVQRRDAALFKSTDTTGGANPAADFAKAAATKNVERFGKLYDSGVSAGADDIAVSELEHILSSTPTGNVAGMKLWAKQKLGIDIGDVSDLEAATAIINKLAPANREAGSGPLSENDMSMLIHTLPSIWGTPEGNTKIITTIKGLIQYRKAQGDIAAQALNQDISPKEAMAKLAALPNPLEQYRPKDTTNTNPTAAAPATSGGANPSIDEIIKRNQGGT